MKHALLLSLATLLPLSSLAAAPCQRTVAANPNVVIPVHVTSQPQVSNHPQRPGLSFNRYTVTLGAQNEFDQICVSQREAVMLFTLADPQRYEFVDLRFYENGLPSTQIVQTEIQGGYARAINKNDARVQIKYVLVLRDRATGAVITKDPLVTNEPD